MTARSGLQFDDRLWVCGYCHAQCVDYSTMKEHREKRCRVRQAITRRKSQLAADQRIRLETPACLLAEGQKVLEEWGVR